MTLVVLAGQPIISYAKSVQNKDDMTHEIKDVENDGVGYIQVLHVRPGNMAQVYCIGT